jgi:hypothetical protein
VPHGSHGRFAFAGLWPAALTGVLIAQAAGCAPKARTGQVLFSPDGQRVAFVRVEEAVALAPGLPRGWQEVHGRWCSVADPAVQFAVKADALGPDYADVSAADVVRLAFSPSGRLLAVMSPHRITVIELDGGEAWRVTPEGALPSSLAWLGEEEIVYAAAAPEKLTERKDPLRPWAERAVWRQIVTRPVPQRTEVHWMRRCRIRPAAYVLACGVTESFSPDGRFMVYMDPPAGGQWHVLDVAAREARAFGAPRAAALGVAWRPDASAAACLAQLPDERQLQAVLLDTRRMRAFDMSRPFCQCFTAARPTLAPRWTADGQCFAVNAVYGGGCLVCPQPWEVRRVAERLTKHVDPIDVTWSPDVAPLPARPWVRVVAPDGEWYAVDDRGERFVTLGRFAGRWAISPDGSRTAEVDEKGNVTIRRVELPPAEPPPAATTQPAAAQPAAKPATRPARARAATEPSPTTRPAAALPTTRPATPVADAADPAADQIERMVERFVEELERLAGEPAPTTRPAGD